jgi:hypothetical protein
MLACITHPGLHHPRRTALFALLFVLIAAVVGGSAASKLNAPNALRTPPPKSLTPAPRSSAPPAPSRPPA